MDIPRVHLRGSDDSAACGIGGKRPQLAGSPSEVTCAACRRGWRAKPRTAAADARWNRLRDQITRDAETEQEIGDDYSETGGPDAWDSPSKHWGKAEALRGVLAAMERMEAER